MAERESVKRIRIKTTAHDPLSLAQCFRSHLSTGGVFIKTRSLLPEGTKVVVELLYATGERALHGDGKVAWAREDGPSGSAGLHLELIWDPPSLGTVHEVIALASAQRRSVPPPPVRPPATQRNHGSLPPLPAVFAGQHPRIESPASALAAPAGAVARPPPDPAADLELPTDVTDMGQKVAPREDTEPMAESQAGILVAMESLPPGPRPSSAPFAPAEPPSLGAGPPSTPPPLEAATPEVTDHQLEADFLAHAGKPSTEPEEETANRRGSTTAGLGVLGWLKRALGRRP